MINELKEKAYEENRKRDTNCSVTFHTNVDGITPYSYLKQGKVPCWISPWVLILAMLLQLDTMYLCILRSHVPTVRLTVTK